MHKREEARKCVEKASSYGIIKERGVGYMKISTKGRYALRLMLDLAVHDSTGYIPLRDISERQKLSIKYLEQIVMQLSKANFLKATRGAQGGYKLVKEPAAYTVGDILRITEGSLAPVSCLTMEAAECDREDECATHAVWSGLYDVINNYLDSITLEDLLNQNRQNDYSI